MQVEKDEHDVIWWATCELRFVKRVKPYGDAHGVEYQALQQLWRGAEGREQWRDVPLASEQPR